MPKLVKSTRPPWMPERVAHGGRKKPNTDVYNGTQWRKLATMHKRANPCCVACMDKGIVSPAQVTDHILPINMGGEVYAWHNLQSLCKRCHDVKSGQEARGGKGGV